MRQRVVTRFESFAQATEEFGHLEAIGAVFYRMAVKLRSLWSVQADTMPVYPAFR
jgi:Mn-containing catalase